MKNKGLGFIIPVLIFVAATFVAIFGITIYDENGRDAFTVPSVSDIRFGIDIRGGVEAYFEPDESAQNVTAENLDAARSIIELRLDQNNIADREVTVDYGNQRIIVRFPWKSNETSFNPQTAIQELGETGMLTFQDPEGNIIIQGTDVREAKAGNIQTESGGLEPVVELTLNDSGRESFAEATKTYLGQSISIYMDDQLISAPVVNDEIPSGQAIISGIGDYAEAKQLADTINAGALPFKLVSNSNSSISPTLGQSSLDTMVYAGVIAFALISIFMLIAYKIQGLVAVFTLLGQIVAQLLVLSISQYTLTLPGIAGIILSIGMGVDANVITAERIKDEINTGKTIRASIEAGYKKAFSAILDGNVTSAIAAILLMILGSGSMISFGFTLLVGLIFNLVIGVFVARCMSKSLGNLKWNKNKKLYGYKEPKALTEGGES